MLTLILQFEFLKVGIRKEPVLIQENSIENSVQNCLPYIH